MTSPLIGPRGLATQAAGATAGPTDLRSGVVVAVTARGINVAVADGLVEAAAHVGSYNPAVGDPVAMVRFLDSWLILGRPVGAGTAVDFATAGSAAGTTLLAGIGLSGGGATMATSTGSAVTVPRYTVTFYHPANHWVMLLCGMSWFSSATNDWLTVSLRNSYAGNARVGYVNLIQAGNTSFGQFATWAAMIPPSYGGKAASYYMDLQRVSGTGSSRIDDIADRRGFLLALDIGDGSVVDTK